MKVKQLRQIISSCNDDVDVVIEVEPKPKMVYGGTPIVDIERVSIGFDWDMNRLILISNVKIAEITDKS